MTLPPVVHSQIEKLSAELASFAGEVGAGGGIVAVRAAVAVVTKIQQLMGGRAYARNQEEDGLGRGDAQAVIRVHDEKLEALKRLVNELNGQPLLVAAQFTCEADAIVAAVPGAEIVTTDTLPAKLPRWIAGDIPVLVANPASLGHGVDGLQDGGARHVCFFSQTWQSAKRQQFIARLRRGGQERRVVVHDIVAGGFLEETDDGSSRYRRSMDEIMLDRVTGQITDQTSMLKALIAEAQRTSPGDPGGAAKSKIDFEQEVSS